MSILKKTETVKIDDQDEGPLYSRSRRRKLTAEDLDSNIQLNRIEDCLREIKEIRENFVAIYEDEYDEPEDLSAPESPLDERQPERRLLWLRFIKRRHQLLNQVMTDLLEVIACEVGLDRVDKELYSDRYIPREMYDAAVAMAANKGA